MGTAGAIVVILITIVAGVLGRVYLGERFGPHAALAAVLIVSGVILSGLRRS